ncbi:MAG: FG-GAP-like repeat-containing protein [Bacteroidota bacterium]
MILLAGPIYAQDFIDVTRSAFVVVPDSQTSGDISWADFDADGFMDFAIVGNKGGITPFHTELYRYNPGTSTFVRFAGTLAIPKVQNSRPAWGDYDGDGDLDFLVVGEDNLGVRHAKIYQNNGILFTEDISVSVRLAAANVSNGAASFADFNNDGQLDIAIAGQAATGPIFRLYRHENLPNNNFLADTVLPGLINPYISWGDYDADGDLDLAYCGTTQTGQSSTKLYNNLGNGNFASINTVVEDVRDGSIEWGDYDNDGDMDVLISGIDNVGDRLTSIYKNNGNQGFALVTAGLTGVSNGEAVWVDFNNDGWLDISITGQDGASGNDRTTLLYQNDTNGNFIQLSASSLLVDVNNGARIAWADYNGDDKLDVMVAGTDLSPSNYKTRLYRNNLSSSNTTPSAPVNLFATQTGAAINLSWDPPTNLSTILQQGITYNIQIGSSPGSDDIKVAQANLSNGFYRVAGPGPLNATAYTLTNTNLVSGNTYYWRVQAIDADFEGGPWSAQGSFVYTNPFNFSSIFNDVTGTKFDLPPPGLTEASIELGDTDNDGDLDLIYCGSQGLNAQLIYYRYSQINNRFEATDLTTVPDITRGDVALGDVDGDGDLDLAVAGNSLTLNGTKILNIYSNSGNGSFGTPTRVLTGVNDASIDFGDFDKDGDLDILVTGNGGTGTLIYVNASTPGNLSFPNPQSFGLPSVERGDAKFGDYNNDGYPDIAITGNTSSGPITRIYRNNGGTGFSLLASASLPQIFRGELEWADINNDGFLDIIGMGIANNGVTPNTFIQLNNKGIDFISGGTVYNGNNLWSGGLDAGDVNDDGFTDLVICGLESGGTSSQTQLYINNQSFIAPNLVLDGATSGDLQNVGINSDIKLGDYNGDNKLDLFVVGQTGSGGSTSNAFYLYENTDPTANVTPNPPTNLTHEFDGYEVILNWEEPTGTPPTQVDGLNYEVLIYGADPPNTRFRYNHSITDSAASNYGFRKKVDLGNTEHVKELVISGLQPGTYNYTVQTIDQDFEGSAYATTRQFEYEFPTFLNVTNSQSLGDLPRLKNTSLALGDYRGPSGSVATPDGYLDLVVSGESESGDFVTQLYYYQPSSEVFVRDNLTDVNLHQVKNGSVNWGDLNNDGALDLIIMGEASTGLVTRAYFNLFGTFNSNNAASDYRDFQGLKNGSAHIIDFNNDGFRDIYLTGENASGNPSAKMYLSNRKNNVTQIQFKDSVVAGLEGYMNSDADWGDYNNDGFLDLLVSGEASSGPRTRIYPNNTLGGFSSPLTLTSLSHSSVEFADFDADGYADVAISGMSGSTPRTTVYKNNTGINFSVFQNNLQGIQNGTLAFGDYDSDGYKDLILSGNSGTQSTDRALALYRYDPSVDNFVDQPIAAAPITQVNEGASVNWGDFTRDGKLDLLVVGQRSNSPDSNAFDLFRNVAIVTPSSPDAPTINPAIINGYNVELTWEEPASFPDSIERGLTYNVVLSTASNGLDQRSPQSLLSDGARKVVQTGMANERAGFSFYNLPAGTYFWKVQAIDADFEGGPFSAEGSFTFTPPLLLDSTEFIFSASPDGFSNGELDWGDYDNDGDLDLVVSGDQGGSATTTLYRNVNGSLQSTLSFTGLTSAKLEWGDYDHDQDLDLIMNGILSNGNPATLIQKNNGNGTFTEITTHGITDLQNGDIAWIDYDNDGDLDVMVSGVGSTSLESGLFINVGGDVFTPSTVAIQPIKEGQITIVDYNLDGFHDIFVTGDASNTSSAQHFSRLYRNDGLGDFIEITTIIPQLRSSSADWADINGDSYPDLVVCGLNTNDAGQTQVFSNVNGTFTDLLVSVPAVYNGSVAWGDYNDDDLPDLVYTGSVDGFTRFSGIFTNQGSGQFQYESVPSIALGQVDQGSIAWGDFNNDDKLDLALMGQSATSPITRHLNVFRNVDSTLNISPALPQNLQGTSRGDTVILSWDIPNGQSNHTYNVYLGSASSLGDSLSPSANISNGYRRLVQVGNVGNNNSLKLTGLNNGIYFWSVQAIGPDFEGSAFANEQTVRFQRPVYVAANNELLLPGVPENILSGRLNWGDIDQDGDMDLVVNGNDQINDPVLLVLENVDGQLELKSGITGLDNSVAALGDYDNDGVLELIHSGEGTNQLETQVYENDGNGNFSLTSEGENFESIIAGKLDWIDYDNDGDLDLLMIGENANGAFVAMYNNESGLFTIDSYPNFPALTNPSTSWADYDQDGDKDLALYGLDNGNAFIGIYRNEGLRGGFTRLDPASNTFTVSTNGSVDFGDLNNDGFKDLLITGEGSSSTVCDVFLYNSATGSFSLETSLAGVRNGMGIWGDINDDSFQDIVLNGLGDDGSSTSYLYINNQDNTFRLDSVSSANLTGLNDAEISLGDVDLDGKLDIASIGKLNATTGFFGLFKNIDSTANVRPVAPVNLTSITQADSVILEWNDSNNPTGVTYNVVVGSTENGLDILSPMSNTTGFRQIVELGQAGSRTKFRLQDLNAGTYYWAVQAVDQDFEGSPFSVIDSFEFDPPNFIDYNAVLFDNLPAGFQEATSVWLDYNNDGFLDVVVSGNDGVSPITLVYRSDAGRRLELDGAATTLFEDVSSPSLVAADFDGNGWVDICLAGNDNTQAFIQIYFNEEGTFSAGNTNLIAFRDPQMATGDLNHDGFMDLIVSGISASQAVTEVYYNNKNGNFIVVNQNLIDVSGGQLIIQDFDQNGLEDVFVLGENNSNQFIANLYLQDPVQGYQWTPNALPSTFLVSDNSLFEAGDFNQDGLPDLIATGQRGGSNAVVGLRNLGTLDSGSLFDYESLSLDSIPLLQNGNYRWGDYNDDKQIDLLVSGTDVAGAARTELFISQNGGLPLRNDVLASPFLPNMRTGSTVEWADIDNDGKLDILFAGENESNSDILTVFKNIEATQSLAPIAPTGLNIESVGSSLRLEWRSVDPSYSYNIFLAIEGDTLFTNSPLSDTTSGRRKVVRIGNTSYLNNITLAGLEQDRDYIWGVQSVDAGFEGSPFTVSSFSFTPPAFEDVTATRFNTIPTPTNDGKVLVGDYDTDGDLDVVLTSQRNGNDFTRFYKNVGTNFVLDTDNQDKIPGVSSGSLIWSDYDNDNDPDLFITGQQSVGNNIIGIYRNDGGIFTLDEQASSTLVAVSGSSADWADYDLDGDEDLFVMGVRSNGDAFAALYVQQEDGGFLINSTTGEALLPLANGDVRWGDYDKDEAGQAEDAKGHPDLAIVGSNDGIGTAIVYHNEGDGTFTRETTATLPQLNNGSVEFIDLDNNRFPDLLATGTTLVGSPPSSVAVTTILRNDAGTKFRPLANDPNLPAALNGEVITGDYDDNGYADLLFVGKEESGAEREISLFRNLGGFQFRKDILTSNDLDSLEIDYPAWGDFDNDGKLDLFAGSMIPFGSSTAGVGLLKNINQNSNNVPLPPDNLIQTLSGATVELRWAEVLDTTGLLSEFTYNLTLGKLDSLTGRFSPLADLNTYKRYVADEGNVGHNNLISIDNLPSGTYQWCVQSIGKDFEGSLCSEPKAFTFIRPIPEVISDNIATWYPDTEEKVVSNITVASDTNISAVNVWYKGIADTSFISEAAQKNGTNYSFDVTLGKVDELGVAYYFELEGRYGFDVFSDTFYTWREYVEGINFDQLDFGRNVSDYNLLSLPLNLDEKRISEFMEVPEALGRQNRYRWRFWDWIPSDSSFQEYGRSNSTFTEVDPGKGYFLITARQAALNSGRGKVVQANEEVPYIWNLEPGWNLVGNPYYYNISWQDILSVNQAVSDNVSEDLLVYRTTYQSGSSINRLEGAYVFSNGNVSLNIPVRKNPNLNRISAPVARMRGELGSDIWSLDVWMEQGATENQVSGIGMNPEASLGWDKRDIAVPIQLGGYLETRFEQRDTNAPDLSKDIVPTQENFVWKFEVKSSDNEPELKLSWPFIDNSRSSKRLYLFDIDNQKVIDMTANQSYLSTYEGESRHFEIHFGDFRFIQESLKPSKIHLGLPYPNPASEPVLIPISLPESNQTYETLIEVLTLEGKLVRRITADQMKAGFQLMKWDLKDEQMRPVPSGTYLIRLRVKVDGYETTQTSKLVVMGG